MRYFCALLALLFIGLKLHGSIAWPWWVVLAPLWGYALLVVLVFGFVGAVLATMEIDLNQRKGKR